MRNDTRSIPQLNQQQTEILSAALAYAAHKKAVFPCRADKRPLTPNGFKDATTDEAQIRAWWNRWPDALIGLPTGKVNGITVLDIDMDADKNIDGEEVLFQLRQANDELPDTIECLTPRGGRHLYFPYVEGVCNSASKLGRGLDVRGEGGYVIAPPSRVNGCAYEWEGSNPDTPAAMPGWLVALLKEKTAQAPTENADPQIAEGQRNQHLTRLAGKMRRGGMSPGEIEAALLQRNKARCQPLLPEAEVRRIAKSVGRYKPAAPRQGEGVAEQDAEDDLALQFIKDRPLLRYVALWGKWLRWDGYVWRKDETLKVFTEVREALRSAVPPELEKRRRALLSAKTVAAVERLARSDPRAASTVDQWDNHDLILNTPDGQVNLVSGAIRPNDPLKYITKVTAVSPKGECPMWLSFLSKVTDGDADLSGFLQRVAGYCATGLTHEHAFFFLHGSGQNGKNTFVDTLVGILDDRNYSDVAPMETFIDSAFDRHPAEIAKMYGKRLVVADETEDGRAWAESRIKSLTGGGAVTAREMRKDFFTFAPKFKLLITGNHKPMLKNVDKAMRRRLHLIPFNVVIPDKDLVKGYADLLKSEWPGILQWIVNGAVEYHKRGLAPPKAVTEATNEYFDDEDGFARWLEECTEKGAGYTVTNSNAFTNWKMYAERGRLNPGTQRTFKPRMEAKGFTQGNSRARGGRYWDGLRLLQNETDLPI